MRIKLLVGMALLLVLAACGSPRTAPPTAQPNPPQVLGLLKITIEGINGEGQPNATAQWVGQKEGSISPQAITLVDNYPTFTKRGLQFYDFDTTLGSGVYTRYINAVFEITNTTANSFNNMVLDAVNAPGNLGGTGIISIVAANGSTFTGVAGDNMARSFKPIHGVVGKPLIPAVLPEGADLHLLTLTEVGQVKLQFNPATNGIPTNAEPLQYGYVARNFNGGRTIGASGCGGANCNKGYITLAYQFPRPASGPGSPYSFSVYFAVYNDTDTRMSQSLEEQAANTVGGQSAGSVAGVSQVRTLFGSTYAGANALQLCRVFTAGSVSSQLAWLGPDPLPGGCTLPASGSDLRITEVGTNFYVDTIAWFEVYNPTTNPINLNLYTLRAIGINPTIGGVITDPTTFALPSYTLNPGQFVVIGGKVNDNIFNTNKSVYVTSGVLTPFWYSSGCIELEKAGQTVDFVSFGTCVRVPLTPGAWSGPAVAALPSSATDYGRSIVRNILNADTNTNADWSLRDFVTPAAVNDVIAGAVDTDNDGLPDNAEVSGGSFAGYDLYSMGARTGVPDMFVEVDHMNNPADPAMVTQKAALDKVVAAFAAQGRAVHFDSGNKFSATFSPVNHNLGNANFLLPFTINIELGAVAGFTNFYQVKANNFDYSRLPIFHYMIIGSSRVLAGTCGSSGVAELPGNDSLVSLGACGHNTSNAASTNLLNNFQAATIMHEFGHNLNLRHGGNEDQNHKPNYISIMNYEFQLNGIGPVVGAGTGDRYYLDHGFHGQTYAGLVNSGFTNTFSINYSNGSSAALNEAAINENNGLGRGAAVVDYNNNFVTEAAVAFDTNFTGTQTTLNDFNDWANLQLPLGKKVRVFTNNINIQANKEKKQMRFSPASSDQQEPSQEEFFWPRGLQLPTNGQPQQVTHQHR